MTRIDKAEARWPVRGYAPGAYSCKCRKCGQAFIGDKRAYQCQDCVIQDIAALPARGVGVPEELAKKAIDNSIARLQALPDYAGRPAWEEVVAEEIRAALSPTDAMDTCGKCMGSGYGGHPDSGVICPDCNGEGGILAPTDAAQAPFRIEDMTLADLMRDPLYEEATTPATDAAQAREAAARLLLDMLHMRNGAHEGVTKDDAQAMWEAASTRVGYAAVDAFLRSIIGEARP